MVSARDILTSVIAQLNDMQTKKDAELEDIKGFLTELDDEIYKVEKTMGWDE